MNSQQARSRVQLAIAGVISTLAGSMLSGPVLAAQLWAGVGKADITNEQAGLINDRLYVKALVIKDDATTAAIVTVDAVSLGEIGYIGNDYLQKVRAQIEKECQIPPEHVLINASHCHGVVCAEVDQRTLQAVKDACQNLVPVDVGCGVGREDRIMENRRLKLKNGQEADVRHAYSLPPDEEVAEVGPVDPEIGMLRIDRKDGRTLAVIYNFACHPIQGVPNGGITADLIGFASKVIEDNLSDGTMALFLQGCAGDINPVWYKDVDQPRNAEPLGNLLGLSALQGLRKVQCRADNRLTVRRETAQLPRANFAERIVAGIRADPAAAVFAGNKPQPEDVHSVGCEVQRVRVNFPPTIPPVPARQSSGREDLSRLDAENRRNMQAYINNIYTMEQLTRVQTNLALLRKHQADNLASPKQTLEVEFLGVRIGDLVLITFPGELTVQIGLNIKRMSPHELTFRGRYTNGYIYYTPTAEQLANPGGAQEDCDCLLAPDWQQMFEDKVAEMLGRL